MKVLFLGDSITESNRDTADPLSLGDGYVFILHEKLRNLYEDVKFEFANRGIRHSRAEDLAARAGSELKAERPDVAVVLIGVNDVWSREELEAHLDTEKFAVSYESLLKQIKDSGAKLIVVEPFLFGVPDKKRFRRDFDRMLKIIRAEAAKYADAFVPLDEMFAGVSQSVGISAYSADGIHPTHRAARLIADNVIKKIKQFL